MMNATMRSIFSALVASCPLFVLALAKPIWCGDPKMPSTITPDAKIQELLRRVVRAKGEDDQEPKGAMKALNDIALRKPEVLAPQIVYYSLHVKDEKEAWSILGIMKQFGARWDSEMRQGLIPLLETTDQDTLKEVANWLAAIDGHARPRPDVNILSYRETLMRQKNSPPPGLVNYVYRLAPSQALLLFGEIYSREPQIPLTWPRSLMWSDHVVQTVKWRVINRFLQEGDLEKAHKELDGLSKHDGWHARRYVVEVLDDIPKLGTPEIVNRLKKDAHPLVRDAAKFLK